MCHTVDHTPMPQPDTYIVFIPVTGRKKMKPFTLIHPDYESLRFLRSSIIIIEGIPGSGKSSLCEKLFKYLTEVGFTVKNFEEEVNVPFLELFLSDMKKYAFAFQMSALSNRQKIYSHANDYARREGGIAIIDRSLYGDISFAALHHEYGNISDEEWAIYEHTVDRTPMPQPSKVIYLDVDIETSMERISIRNRGSEASSYSYKYLYDLDVNYKVIIEESGIPVTYIDWNKPRELNRNDLLSVCNELKDEY